jgi:hypothetical protein
MITGTRSLRLLVALVAATLPAAPATAQHRFEMSGSVTATETYDNNVFSEPDDPRQDVVSRVTPRLGVGYRSPRFDIGVQYAREAEAFSRNRELSTLRARQDAGLDLRWSPGGGFEAVGRAYYAETHNPGEIPFLIGVDLRGVDLVGLQLRRTLAHRFSTFGSLSRRLGARTRVAVEHAFTQDEVVGVLTSVTHTAAARLDRQVGPVDALSLAYGVRQFTALGDVNTSHALTVAWAREVTPRAHIELKAGPRLSGRQVGPELGATLSHRFRRGSATLSYVQTETAIIGRPRPVRAGSLGATFTHSLNRTLTVTVGPSMLHTRGKAVEATVVGTSVELACRLSRHLSLAATHRLSIQQAELDGRPREEIVHNTVLLRLVAGSTN